MKCLLGHLHYCPHIQIGLFHQCSMQLCGDVGRSQMSVRGPIIFVTLNFFFVLLFPSTYPLLTVFSHTTMYRCSTQKCLNLNDTSIRHVCCDVTQSYLISDSSNSFWRRVVSLFTYSLSLAYRRVHKSIPNIMVAILVSWWALAPTPSSLSRHGTALCGSIIIHLDFSLDIETMDIWPLTKNNRGNDQHE